MADGHTSSSLDTGAEIIRSRTWRRDRVTITAQNHGYAVDADGLPPGLNVSHLNLNDNTIEGLTHREMPLLTIQFHSEASPGPLDNEYLFDRFLDLIREYR